MPIALSCSECDKQLRVKDELAGKKIKCPDCQAVLVVPDPRIRAAKTRAAGREDEDENDEDASKPAIKGQKKGRKRIHKEKAPNLGLILGLSGAGAGVLILGAVLAFFLWPKKPANNTVAAANSSGTGTDAGVTRPNPGLPVRRPGPGGIIVIPGNPVVPIVGAGQAKPEVYEKLLKSTAFIVIATSKYTGFGSGALIDRDERLVVTNSHVVGKEPMATLFFPAVDPTTKKLITDPNWYKNNRDRSVQGKVVFKDPKRDLALVQLTHVPAGVPAVPLVAQSAKVAENIHSIGSSGIQDGALWRYTHGAVRQIYEKKMEFEDHFKEKILVHCWMIETNAATNQGDSGGPIVNDRGQLVAIVQGAVRADPNDQQRMVSYNVDIREIHYALGEHYKSQGKVYELPKLSDIDPGDQIALAKKLADPDASVRVQAAKIIADFGPEARALVPALIKACKDDNPVVRLAVIKALELIGPPTAEAAPLLLELVDSTSPEQKRYAAAMLAKPNLVKKDQAFAGLIKLAKDSDAETRRKAVAGLGLLGAVDKKTAAGVLLERLADDDSLVRAGAAFALGQLGADVKADVLVKLIEVLGDPEAVVAQAASDAIRQLGDPAEADLPLLLKGVQSKKAIERATALELLARMGPKAKPALPQVEQGLKDSDMRVRLAAIALAGALGKEARSLVPVLGKMLEEPIKAEPMGDATASKETVGDNRMREILLRSACMVMWGDVSANTPQANTVVVTTTLKIPESAFVVHKEECLILSPLDNLADHKNVIALFPVKSRGNLVTRGMDYLSNFNVIGIPGLVVGTNPKTNLALIKLARLPREAEALPLAPKAPDSGINIAALVADLDAKTNLVEFWQLHRGKVVGVKHQKGVGQLEGSFVIFDGTLSDRDSGYPVVDELGNVVGIGMKFVDEQGQKVPVGVDVKEFRPLIEDYFKKIGRNFRETATRAGLGNPTQNQFRITIAKALAQMGPDPADGLAALRKALKDKEAPASVRNQVALALGAVTADAVATGGASTQAMRTMVQGVIGDLLQAAALEDNPDAIEEGIAKLGKDAVPPLLNKLSDNDNKIKIAVMRALGRIGPAAKDALSKLRLYPGSPIVAPEVAKAATEAIEKIKP